MKRISTFLMVLLALSTRLLANTPAYPSSDLKFTLQDGARLTLTFKAGGGTSRIVVVKEGSPITGVPVNGKDYVANTQFQTANTLFEAPGEYVVAKTSWSSVTIENLKPATAYYVAIFEYNGTGTATQYLNLALTGSQFTAAAPTQAATDLITTAQTGNTISLSWTKGNGSGRLLVARKGSAVNLAPQDLKTYYAYDGTYEGASTHLGDGNYTVYSGNGNSTVVKNLEPNVTYHFALFEFNGSSSPVYMQQSVTVQAASHAGPTQAVNNINYSYLEGNSFTISASGGNGTRRLVVMKKGAPVTAVPVNGVSYEANTAFGAGTEIAPGEFVVANTIGNKNITNLEKETEYHLRIYEFDVDKNGYPYYLTSAFGQSQKSTCTKPTSIAHNLKLTKLTGNTATLTFSVSGNYGQYRMLIMKEGSAVDAVPQDLKYYSGNKAFGLGTQIIPGNYVIYSGANGTTFITEGLKPGATYHLSIYEYNGTNAPVYSAEGATFQFTVPAEPTAPATGAWFTFHEGNAFRAVWQNGAGSHRLVVAKKGTAVTAVPEDYTIYTANANFGEGNELAPGEFVVYNGDYNSVDLKKLEIGTGYHIAVFEYNLNSNGLPDYLTSTKLTASSSTLGYPTVQATIQGVSNVEATKAAINFTKGNGAYCIFIMREGSAVTAAPEDGVKYTGNAVFGNNPLGNSGHYLMGYAAASGSYNVSNLKPLTTYHVSVWEYNGNSGPAYLRPGHSYSFTTADVVGATTPTSNAAAPQFEGVDGNRFTFKWTNGNGEKRLVIMRKDNPVTFVPSSSINYIANAAFGSGTDLGDGQYAVYNNSGSSIDISNLQPASTYYLAVFEYNGAGSTLRYLSSGALTASRATALPPATISSNATAIIGTNAITLNWDKGNGAGRIVVMKEGNTVTATPVDLNVYPASPVFKNGPQISAGEYIVYSGSGNSVTVTGLTAEIQYHFSVFEYNGKDAPVYNTAALQGHVVISSPLPVTWRYFTAVTKASGVLLSWGTATETENRRFIIERSTDGIRFTDLQIIPGAVNSSQSNDYSFVDSHNPAGKLFYRIRQEDADGTTSWSKIVAVVTASEKVGYYIWPNPAQNQLNINLQGSTQKVIVYIYNIQGQLCQSESLVNSRQMDISRLKGGLYNVVLLMEGQRYSFRLIKQ